MTNGPERSLSEVKSELDALLSNPYGRAGRARRRALRSAATRPGREITAWIDWWKSLPTWIQGDSGPAIALCVELGRAGHLATSKSDMRRVARLLPDGMWELSAEMAHRAVAVEEILNGMVGVTEVMRQLREDTWAAAFGQRLDQVSGLKSMLQTTPVLVIGETGTGKELIAQAIGRCMPGTLSKKGTWKPANFESEHLASLPQGLVSSALFGHEKGAFSGADKQHIGVLERCHGGVVFLDEVAELPPDTQVSLLRSLQEGKVRRMGGVKETDASPRVVSATHQDLEQLVARDTFRRDLFHRLSSVVIKIPPLRDRNKDIPSLVQAETRQLDIDLRIEVRDKAEQFLAGRGAGYTWPGNVRELASVVRTLALGLEPRLVEPTPEPTHGEIPEMMLQGEWAMARVQSWYAQRVSLQCHNLVTAAKQLEIDRGTLRKYLRKAASS